MPRRHNYLSPQYLGCLVISLCLVGGALEAQETAQVTEVEGITEYRLDNGLRFLLFPDAEHEEY